MNIKKVKQYIGVAQKALDLLKAEIENEDGGLLEEMMEQTKVVPPSPEPEKKKEEPVSKPSVHKPPDEWLKLRAKHIQDLLAIDVWPEAFSSPAALKEVGEKDQVDRANCVLDMILDRPVKGFNFLDFGCGDGWIAQEIVKRGVMSSTGYDIASSDHWSKVANVKFTTTLAQLPENNYDVIMLYDVLDHCEDPVVVMDSVLKLTKRDGVVYVRCHPWTSKHASHVFKQGVNKAYIHLFLNPEELKGITGKLPMFTRQEKDPITAYKWWFNHFEIKRERIIREQVHGFFLNPAFKELLSTEQQIPEDKLDEFMKFMEIQFADYILTPKVQ